MAFHSYIVAAEFHTRADAIEAMKQVVAEVTALSLDEESCQITTGPKARMIQRFFYCTWNGGIKPVLRHTLPHRTLSMPKIV
jgi:hypothetical protein